MSVLHWKDSQAQGVTPCGNIDSAKEGGLSPVHSYIREILSAGEVPEIFVLERVPPSESWQEAERRQIAKYRNSRNLELPILILPQTHKSSAVEIASIRLTNVSDGG